MHGQKQLANIFKIYSISTTLQHARVGQEEHGTRREVWTEGTPAS